jgi:hypothetical protein
MCSLFCGLFLLLLGVSIVINSVFGLHLPIVKLFFAGFLIYLGIKILLPSQHRWEWHCSGKNTCAMEQHIEGDRYTIRFGSSTVDLTSLQSLTEPKTVYVDTQFANVTVLLPANVPVRVKADLSFGSVQLPRNIEGSEYTNLHGAPNPLLTILIDSSFASVIVKEATSR